MKKLAEEFGLSFKLYEKYGFLKLKKNVLQGKINGKKIKIYDIYIDRIRCTIVNKKRYFGKISGYCSIKDLRKILEKL
ncbi:MAG: hypothetical protein GF390_00460 [Candidatus Pacebacteria bacterium]|nr:hypothetical protein [Candidatus Paceibacterota bacterium]